MKLSHWGFDFFFGSFDLYQGKRNEHKLVDEKWIDILHKRDCDRKAYIGCKRKEANAVATIRLSTSPVMASAGKMLAYNSNHGQRNMI